MSRAFLEVNKGEDFMTLGEKIAYSRKQIGISQQELAKRTGISLRTITFYEANSHKPRSEKNYVALAEALGVTVLFLKKEDIPEDDEVEVLKNQFNALFAGGKLSENDMDEIMSAVQEAYAITKLESKRKRKNDTI